MLLARVTWSGCLSVYDQRLKRRLTVECWHFKNRSGRIYSFLNIVTVHIKILIVPEL
jgi:hypothetical protein